MLARRPEIVGRSRWKKVQSPGEVCIRRGRWSCATPDAWHQGSGLPDRGLTKEGLPYGSPSSFQAPWNARTALPWPKTPRTDADEFP
jgi:hypothetical protein